jgi:hypothetical protein
MTEIMLLTSSAMQSLTKSLESLSLKDFDGENVNSYVSVVKGVNEQLDNNNQVPHDMFELVGDGLRKCLMTKFVQPVTKKRFHKDAQPDWTGGGGGESLAEKLSHHSGLNTAKLFKDLCFSTW